MAIQRTIPELSYTGYWGFPGSENQWRELSAEQREQWSFAHTGCLVAFPSWEPPVNCLHTSCRIARHELPAIAETNSILRGEKYDGWLRFTDRPTLAKIFRAYRKAARETGIYDPWKLDYRLMVSAAVGGR